MHLAVVASSSPFSKASWSGIPFFATREIQRRFAKVTVIDTPRVDRLLVKAHKFATGRIQLLREPMIVDLYARYLDRMLRKIGADAVVSIGAPHKIAGLLDRWPVVHVTDAMFDTIVRYYPKYEAMHSRSMRMGHALQRRIVERSAGLLVASRWAARSAAQHYDQPETTFTVAPMGANFETPPPPPAMRTNAGPLKLLFAGYDWDRKGGPLVLAILEVLRRSEPEAQLHIVGSTPRAAVGQAGVTLHGPLSKSDPHQARLFESLFADAHFFCMPSHQEAYGLVYCEACAYGLPPVARDTGGVGEIVKHGENGLLLPPDAGAETYAHAILDIWGDAQAYRSMQANARQAFEARLNWQAWGASLETVLQGAIQQGGLRGRP